MQSKDPGVLYVQRHFRSRDDVVFPIHHFQDDTRGFPGWASEAKIGFSTDQRYVCGAEVNPRVVVVVCKTSR